MKFKLFEVYTSRMEETVNKWLQENPNIVILHHQAYERSDYSVVTIFYKEIEI